MNTGTRRYPIGPLLDLLVGRGMTRTAAARMLGMSGSSLQDATRLGLLVKAADRCAMKAGLHPAEVWPSWADDALEDHGKDCPECGTRFIPNRKGHTWCTPACNQRERWRRRDHKRRSTPEGRALEAARSKRYRAAMGEAARRVERLKRREREASQNAEQRARRSARSAAWQLDRYRNDPEFRAAKLARQREYERRNAEVIRARRAARRERRNEAA